MRVTQSTIYRNYVSNLDTANENLSNISRQVSSGKRITQLKDDPAGSAEVVGLDKQQADLDQYQYNTNSGTYSLSVADSALNEVNSLISSIYSKGSEATSGTLSSDDRAAIGTEVRTLRDQIVSLANSQANGKYIFAGSKSSSAAFTQDGDDVTYQGDDDVNTIAVGNGLEAQQNVAGSEAFSPIFSAVNDLLQGIDGNDTSAIADSLQEVTSALTGLGQVRGTIGANMSMLDNVKNNLSLQDTSLKGQLSNVEDANMADAAVQLKQAQTVLQTTISSGSNLLPQTNLFDILA
jgi:flagellar hook-associated protein 3 FlgL